MNYPYYIIFDPQDDEELPLEIPTEHIKTGDDIHVNRYCETLLPSEMTVFRSLDAARGLFKAAGYTEEQMEKFRFLRSIGICFRCGSPLFPSTCGSEMEYTSQCFSCDEDFFSVEQNTGKDAGMDEYFNALPESGFLTKQAIKEGDKVFLDPGDAEPVTITKVYEKDGPQRAKDGFTVATAYHGLDWAIYKNANGDGYAAAPRSVGT